MIALRIAAAIACREKENAHAPLPCMQCPACKKILSGNSPDVIYVNKGDKTVLGVDPIRVVREDVRIAPNELPAKIYIIEEAHLMNQNAQNAFLLTLEEPPPYVHFLLLCESASALLETVRSRAVTLRTEPIPTAQIEQYLLKSIPDAKRVDGEQLREIVAAADGSIGRAVALLDPALYKPLSEKRSTARKFVQLCTSHASATDVALYLRALPQKRDELTEMLNELLYCLRDLLLCKQTEHAPLCFFADREEACTLAYGFTTPALLRICESVQLTVDRLRMNANVRLTLLSLAKDCGLL
jgi:DNA polymerase-3 subunit delta'